jgi:hypothetical protein
MSAELKAKVVIKQTREITVEFNYAEYYAQMKKSDMDYTEEQIRKGWVKLIKKNEHHINNKTKLDDSNELLEDYSSVIEHFIFNK